MILFTLLLVATIAALVLWRTVKVEPTTPSGHPTGEDPRRVRGLGWAALVLGAFALVTLIGASIYTQSVGQAKVIVNWGGAIAGQDTTPGLGFKAPWQHTVSFDLFSQTLTYAGQKDKAPDYTGGKVNGQEVTAYVSGGTSADMDIVITYNLDAQHVTSLYKQFRSQERFTSQIVNPKVLDEIRRVPPAYQPIPFRGEDKAEATDKIRAAIQQALAGYGVDVTQVTIQDVRYPDDVESSIKAVQVAQQKQAENEALQRAATVEAQTKVIQAEGDANAVVAKAKGDSAANDLLTKSLTPQVLQQHYIDAINKAGTVVVTGGGTTPLLNISGAK